MRKWLLNPIQWILFMSVLGFTGCKDTISIQVNVTGLSDNQSLTVQLIKVGRSDTILDSSIFTGNTSHNLSAKDINAGDDFSIVISTPPTTDTCTISDGTRTALYNFNPAPVDIKCSATSFTLGGTLSGLGSGESLVVLVNGSEKETLSSNGTFTLDTHISNGSSFTVSSFTEPGDKGCVVTNGSGTPTTDVSNVSIVCQKANLLFLSNNFLGNFGTRAAAQSQCQTAYIAHYSSYFTCSGGIAPFISINADEEIRDMPTLYTFREDAPIYGVKQYYDNANIKNHTKMADNWADLLDGSIDEPFAIDDSFTSYRTGSLEDGSISTKTCRNWTDNNAFDYGTLGSPRLNDSNWMQSSSTSHCANYLPILCLCMQTNENVADQYTVGGSVTGNTGDVVLSLNSGDQTITIAEGDSSYFFADALDDASTYTVTVTSSPSGQACLLENNTGSISGDSIRNVNVTCGSSTLTLGGALTGLTGTGTVTLSLNSGDQTKSLTANGSFSFDTLLDAGATYDVTVSSTPQYVDCTVTHGMGTITSTVSNITITCSGTKNFLFPTTSSYTAALTSRATVDGYCSATRTATYPTLPCRSVHAFISFGSSDEIRDMPSLYSTNTSLPILNAAHSYDLLANNWALLLDESALDHNLTVDWWSGSSTSGATSMSDCSTWTSTAHVRDASVGWGEDSMDFSAVFWTGTSDGYCDESHQVMCLCSQ